MVKKFTFLFVAFCLVLLFFVPVQANAGIVLKSSLAEVTYPTSIRFSISAQSSAGITEIRLHYTTEQISFVNVFSEAVLEFEPAQSVTANWTWDLRRSGGLPPGITIIYWWTISDGTGARLQTPKEYLKFEDTRFDWQTLSEDRINLHWYEGTPAFAREVMNTTKDALSRLYRDTGAMLKTDVRIYLYANSPDLLGSMLYPQEWTGGVAFTEFGVISIGISAANLAWGKTAMEHELTHLVIHQMTFNPYSGLPTWLDEGLAMYNQSSVDFSFVNALNNAIRNDSLISLQTLSSPFSSYADIAYLSYAQSWATVEYLIGTYGSEKMADLLEIFRHGSTSDNALLQVYGLTTRGLYEEWRQYIRDTVSSVRPEALAILPR